MDVIDQVEFEGKIINVLYEPEHCMMFSDIWLEAKAKKIVALVRHEGWKSPEEVYGVNGQ